MPLGERIGPSTREFAAISGLYMNTTNWVAERGGFEPPVPRGLIRVKFGPSLAHYLAPNKSIRAGENLFALDSAPVGISLVPFVRWADGRNLVTSNIRRRFGVRISASRADSQPLNIGTAR